MRRLLIISNAFYPTPSVSAVRMTRWARSLPDHGWAVTALARHSGHEAAPDALARDVHPTARLSHLTTPPKSGPGGPRPLWKRSIEALRLSELSVPDSALGVFRLCRPRSLAAAREAAPDLVLSTSTPHSIHDLGWWVAQQLGVPWIADFRDPMGIDVRYRPKGLGRLRPLAHRAYERRIYERAAAVIHLNPVHARWARRAFPFAAHRCHTLENGFPEELAAAADSASPAVDPARIVAVGSMGTQEADRLARAIASLNHTDRSLELRLVGHPPENADSLRAILGPRLVTTGQVPHDRALGEIAQATVLVSCLSEFRATSLALGTKAIEYLATGRPTLMINPTFSDRLLGRSQHGVVWTSKPTSEQLADALSQALDAGPRPRAQVLAFRARYAWPALAARLAPILDAAASR